MSGREPTISVVLPNLDGARHLEAAIGSFRAQDYPHKELVIVDGGSQDGSHEIIARACRDGFDVHWVREADSGISDAFIRGFARSRGDVVGFLGSDDRLVPGIFRRIAQMATVVDYDVIWFDSYTWFVQEGRIDLRRPPVQEITRANLLAHGTLVGWQNFYARRHVYDRDLPDRDVRWAMDYELLMRLAVQDHLFLYVPQTATVNLFDTGSVLGGNISSDRDGRQYEESCAIAEKYADGVTIPVFRRRP